MRQVASLSTGRVFRLVNPSPHNWAETPLLITCDGQLPIEILEANYQQSERLGLICEECREKVFITQAKKIDTDKRKYVAGAFYSHYSTKLKDFCSRRHQSPEGKAAYRQVLAPESRGQWLSRFQRCFVWAVLADPVEPILKRANEEKRRIGWTPEHEEQIFRFEFIQPKFHEPRKGHFKDKGYSVNVKQLIKVIGQTALDEDARMIFHRAMDISLDQILAESKWDNADDWKANREEPPLMALKGHALAERLSTLDPEVAEIYRSQALVRAELIKNVAGGEIAQRHCMHLAFDFILAAPQKKMFDTLLWDSLSVLEASGDPVLARLDTAHKRYASNPTGAAEKEIGSALLETKVSVIEYLVQRIATCPWIYIWESACEYADIQAQKAQRADRRNTATRGKGFA